MCVQKCDVSILDAHSPKLKDEIVQDTRFGFVMRSLYSML
jgi:hypothetical protein